MKERQEIIRILETAIKEGKIDNLPRLDVAGFRYTPAEMLEEIRHPERDLGTHFYLRLSEALCPGFDTN